MNKQITILGIESSCDETSAAIMQDGKIISNIVSSQQFHFKYGGVVPELASRAHQKYIIPVVNQALEIAKISATDLDAVAFTNGPGLMGSLLVGVNFSKFYAFGLQIPYIAVNHIEAHIYSTFLEDEKPNFPFLALIISGGHTQLIIVNSDFKYEIIGETKDDAVGEAFDKVAKLLNLTYPGGPIIDKLAVSGDNKSISFPTAFPQEGNFNFSFSGIKTSVLYYLKENYPDYKNGLPQETVNNICASFQKTVVDSIVKKTMSAAKKYDITDIAIAGGVSANSELRNRFYTIGKENEKNIFIPKMAYCTDNGAMIANVGYRKYLSGFKSSLTVSAVPDLILA